MYVNFLVTCHTILCYFATISAESQHHWSDGNHISNFHHSSFGSAKHFGEDTNRKKQLLSEKCKEDPYACGCPACLEKRPDEPCCLNVDPDRLKTDPYGKDDIDDDDAVGSGNHENDRFSHHQTNSHRRDVHFGHSKNHPHFHSHSHVHHINTHHHKQPKNFILSYQFKKTGKHK